ncbi:MAG: HigA family addiction module antidote protein [Planctomycetes bacterium]|nr:HigA family addiction module antidote protein [Planctomycetota bacterium]
MVKKPKTDHPEHPGRVVKRRLKLLGISTKTLAAAVHLSQRRIAKILKGRRSLSADYALRLARYLGTAPREWLSAQLDWDLAQAQVGKRAKVVARIVPHGSEQAVTKEKQEKAEKAKKKKEKKGKKGDGSGKAKKGKNGKKGKKGKKTDQAASTRVIPSSAMAKPSEKRTERKSEHRPHKAAAASVPDAAPARPDDGVHGNSSAH